MKITFSDLDPLVNEQSNNSKQLLNEAKQSIKNY